MVSSQGSSAEALVAYGQPIGMLSGGTGCALLAEVMDAHGGQEQFRRFRTARGNFRIEGDIWSSRGGPPALVSGIFEIGLRDQTVRLHCAVPRRIESSFTPKVIAIHSPEGGFVETQYNPRSSFPLRETERPWDDFQLAYICSYSLWNVITQPFLFAYDGFRTIELSPLEVDGRRLRRVEITFPPHIAAHAPRIICHVAPDGRMHSQDFRFDLLDAAMTSVFADYADVQGVRLPTRRSMFRKTELARANPSIFAEVKIEKLTFY